MALCTVAAVTPNRRFHAVFLVAAILYQLTWMYRAFDLLD
jgi:hypothetical protein